MVLAIVSISIQAFIIIVINAITLSGGLPSEGFSWFCIMLFVACLIMSAISIKLSSTEKNIGSKGKGVAGLIIGIIGTVFAAIFLTIVFITVLAYL